MKRKQSFLGLRLVCGTSIFNANAHLDSGTTRVPLGGFTELQGVQGVQRFSIHKAYGDSNRLPQAHTCEYFFPQSSGD